MKKRLKKKYKFYSADVYRNGKLISSVAQLRKLDAIKTAKQNMSRLGGSSYCIREYERSIRL